jgi:hypothetical protein
VLVAGVVVLPAVPPHPARMSETAATQVRTDKEILSFKEFFLLLAQKIAIV